MKLIDIHSPQDIKPLTIDDLKDLAKQMRAAIINYTSTIGGHVGPNLGDVEALIGVHYVIELPGVIQAFKGNAAQRTVADECNNIEVFLL